MIYKITFNRTFSHLYVEAVFASGLISADGSESWVDITSAFWLEKTNNVLL